MKTLILLLCSVLFSFASIGVNLKVQGIDEMRLFHRVLHHRLQHSGIHPDGVSQYLLEVRVSPISYAKKQRVKTTYTFYNGLVPFYNHETDARYNVDGRDPKAYIVRSIAEKTAKVLIDHMPYLHRHLREIEAYHFRMFDFNVDRKTDFTIHDMYGKEDMLFLEPRNGTLFAVIDTYETLRRTHAAQLHFDTVPKAVYPGAMFVFKTRNGKVGKMRVLHVRRGKIAFEWTWL